MAEVDLAVARVQVSRHGPYRVSGSLPLATQVIGVSAEGDSVEWRQGRVFPREQQYALCRCGHSAHKPFCDGAHSRVAFDGTETASRAPYSEEAKRLRGPTMSLTDSRGLCASGRFCDPNGSVWKLVRTTDEQGARENLTRQCGDCPSGRLVAWDNATGKALE